MWGTRCRAFVLALTFGLTSGCAGSKVYLANNYAVPLSIAVLPVANETTDLDGPPYVRQLIFDTLTSRGHTMIPLNVVDEKLKEQGFTDGGQLGATEPKQLGTWTGADGLFYTTLVNFNYMNLGYYWQRKVTVLGRLVRATDGEKLWETERTWMTLNVVTKNDEALKQFAGQVGTQALEKTLHVPLQPEARIAVKRLIDTLP